MPTVRGHAFVLLEELVCHHIDSFFPGREIKECICFRITRNADVELREDGAADLMHGMEDVLESRRQSRPVRLEYTAGQGSDGASDSMLAFLSENLQLKVAGAVSNQRATRSDISCLAFTASKALTRCGMKRGPPNATQRLIPPKRCLNQLAVAMCC